MQSEKNHTASPLISRNSDIRGIYLPQMSHSTFLNRITCCGKGVDLNFNILQGSGSTATVLRRGGKLHSVYTGRSSPQPVGAIVAATIAPCTYTAYYITASSTFRFRMKK